MVRANMPLAGITVLDFGQVYQGPYATLLMATAGADVIKIEPPNGEPLRRRAPPGKSTTFPIAMLNSNKRAITLNLKDERGKQLLFRMAAKGDVLLENFAPGVMDRLGVGFRVLHEINPRLVYASGSGYGLSGPDRDNLAMDLTIQAVSGLISVTGEPDRPPLKSGPAVVDFLSGIHLYAAVMTALYERSVTGIGRLVEVAMQEAAYPTMTSQLEAYWRTGEVPPRTGNASHNRVPINVYPAKDGTTYFTVGSGGRPRYSWSGAVESDRNFIAGVNTSAAGNGTVVQADAKAKVGPYASQLDFTDKYETVDWSQARYRDYAFIAVDVNPAAPDGTTTMTVRAINQQGVEFDRVTFSRTADGLRHP